MSEVVWKKLGEVCSFKKGTMITSKTAVEGDIPVISGGQKPAFYHNEANRNGDSIVIAGSGAYAGYVSYWTIPVFVSDAFSITPINEKFLQKKYLYYYLLHVQDSIYATKTSGGIPHVYSRFIENFILPVPDLIIQKQIVNHLDTFTSLISRLESELELRQKQYEHYREELLSFEGDEEVEWKKLGEVCSFKKGTMITSKTAVEGDIPVISGGQKPAFYHNEANRNGDSIVIAGSGAYAGYVSYWTIPVFVSDAFSITPINEKFLQKKYLYYYLLHVQDSIYATKTSGGIPHVYSRFIENFILPVPDLIIQQQIVDKLDMFEQLIAALKREIALRKKQYAYYREKLLTFE